MSCKSLYHTKYLKKVFIVYLEASLCYKVKVNPLPYIYVIMNGSLVQMAQFWLIVEKIKSIVEKIKSLFYTISSIFTVFFLLPYFPYIKNVNELIHRVSVLMILTGNESLVVEKTLTANRIAHFHVFLSLGKYRRITKPPTTYRPPTPTPDNHPPTLLLSSLFLSWYIQ